jgi:hypothetical protein
VNEVDEVSGSWEWSLPGGARDNCNSRRPVCVCVGVCVCVCVGHSNFEVNEVKPHETISNPRRGEIFYGHKCNLDLIFFFLLQLHK